MSDYTDIDPISILHSKNSRTEKIDFKTINYSLHCFCSSNKYDPSIKEIIIAFLFNHKYDLILLAMMLEYMFLPVGGIITAFLLEYIKMQLYNYVCYYYARQAWKNFELGKPFIV
jgi:hypothetical protein